MIVCISKFLLTPSYARRLVNTKETNTTYIKEVGDPITKDNVCVEEQHSRQQTQYNFEKQKCHVYHDSSIKKKTFLFITITKKIPTSTSFENYRCKPKHQGEGIGPKGTLMSKMKRTKEKLGCSENNIYQGSKYKG